MTERHCQGCGVTLAPNRNPGNPRKWCSERCRKAQYAGACVDCRAPTNGSNGRGPKAAIRCASCDVANRFVPAVQQRSAELRELVERLWAEGKTSVEIAETVGATGSGKHYVCKCRQQGFDVPHRRTGEGLRRITEAARKNIVIARAARRAAA